MSTLSQLPPTPTPEPEPEEQPSPQKARRTLPWAVRMLWRPVLALAIVAHAFLLFIPLQKPKPKPLPTPSPIDKNVKIDRISLVKKAAPSPQAKPRPKTNRRPKTNVKPAARPRVAPAPKQSPPPKETSTEDNSTPNSNKPSQNKTDSGGSDPCNWGSGIIQKYTARAKQLNLTEIRKDDFKNPGLYFDGDTPKASIGKLENIVRIPRTERTSDGEQINLTFDTVENEIRQSCESNQKELKKLPFNDDDGLYFVSTSLDDPTRGAFISLAKGTSTVASFYLVLWGDDPRKKP